MSILRIGVSSLLGFVCTVCLFSLQRHRRLARPGQSYQTQEQIQAQDALYQGVQAYKKGEYQEALQQFSRAKQWDLKLTEARLYLATAYASQIHFPGLPPRRTGKKVKPRSRSFGNC
jgi:uncharacterized protein HemY